MAHADALAYLYKNWWTLLETIWLCFHSLVRSTKSCLQMYFRWDHFIYFVDLCIWSFKVQKRRISFNLSSINTLFTTTQTHIQILMISHFLIPNSNMLQKLLQNLIIAVFITITNSHINGRLFDSSIDLFQIDSQWFCGLPCVII